MRILSGIQPSGTLHIGNYFGMMRPAIELQARGECYYFIADYHSMTSLTDAAQRRRNTLDVALDFLACGLDPKKSVFYRQSDLPEVCELTWLIGTLTPMGLLERAHSYKDKTAKGISTLVSISYPTPQMARVRFGALTNFMGLNQDRGEASAYGIRHGSYVFLVLNGGNQETASGLMDLFQVTQGVSWDQKYTSERTFTVQLVHMILAIFLLTAFLIAACVVVGVLFFFSRRFAARFFPNSQWGRTDDDQLIRLNLKI